jgi:hypothetical protein
MKETNLNPLFLSLIYDYSHLITCENISKEDFINKLLFNYAVNSDCITLKVIKSDNFQNVKTLDTISTQRKTALFIEAVRRSYFDTIRVNETRTEILFNS